MNYLVLAQTPGGGGGISLENVDANTKDQSSASRHLR